MESPALKRAIVAGVAGLALALPAQAAAQAPAQANLGVGYGYLREAGADGATYATGWLVAFASRPIGAIRWVGEVGGSYRAPADLRQQLMSYQGGVRIEPGRGSVAPFVQTLAGVEHFSETGFTETGFSIQPGGGLDAWLTDRLAIRGQADYRWVRVGPGAGLPARCSALAVLPSCVLRFGRPAQQLVNAGTSEPQNADCAC